MTQRPLLVLVKTPPRVHLVHCLKKTCPDRWTVADKSLEYPSLLAHVQQRHPEMLEPESAA
jgi:hypothetical protein